MKNLAVMILRREKAQQEWKVLMLSLKQILMVVMTLIVDEMFSATKSTT